MKVGLIHLHSFCAHSTLPRKRRWVPFYPYEFRKGHWKLTFSFCFKLVSVVHQVAQKWVIKIRQDIFLEKIKGDFQYVLRTLQSLFAFFVLFHVTHENVNISQLHEACKFIVLKRMRSVTLCSFSRHLMNQLRSCKYQWSCWKKNWKASKIRYVVSID